MVINFTTLAHLFYTIRTYYLSKYQHISISAH